MGNTTVGRLHGWLGAVLGIALVLGAAPGCDSSKTKVQPAPAPTNSVTFNGKTYASAPINDFDPRAIASLPDPAVAAVLEITNWPTDAQVVAFQGKDTNTGVWDTGVGIAWRNLATTMVTVYPLSDSHPLPWTIGLLGTGTVAYTSNTTGLCFSKSGTITVTSFPAVGSFITGHASITAWDLVGGPGPCPVTPSAVSFSVVRAVDFHWGNNLLGTDQLTITRTGGDGSLGPAGVPQTLIENATTPYDPFIDFAHSSSSSSFWFSTSWDASAPRPLNRSIYFQIADTPISTGIPIPITMFAEEVWSPVMLYCNGYSGTLYITSAVTAADGLWSGTFDVPSVSGSTGCPTSYSGTFTITREADQ